METNTGAPPPLDGENALRLSAPSWMHRIPAVVSLLSGDFTTAVPTTIALWFW